MKAVFHQGFSKTFAKLSRILILFISKGHDLFNTHASYSMLVWSVNHAIQKVKDVHTPEPIRLDQHKLDIVMQVWSMHSSQVSPVQNQFGLRCFLPLCDGSPDLWDGQPLPPETVGDAAGVSHAPAPVLHSEGSSVSGPHDRARRPRSTWQRHTTANHAHLKQKTCSAVSRCFHCFSALTVAHLFDLWQKRLLKATPQVCVTTGKTPCVRKTRDSRNTGPDPI